VSKKKKDPPPEPLPSGCGRCHSAPHVISAAGGVGRCDCARGRRLAELDRERGLKSEVLASPVQPMSGFEEEWK
jgi:hypothetical protein